MQPFEEIREFALRPFHLHPQAEALVYDRRRSTASVVGDQVVRVDLLDEAGARWRKVLVRDALLTDTVRRPSRTGDGRYQPGPVIDKRPPQIDVVEQHVRSRIETMVGDG